MEIKTLKICTKTGIHTCRLGSIHLNERDKSVLEDYLTTLTTKHQEEMEKAVEAEREKCISIIKEIRPSVEGNYKLVAFDEIIKALTPTKTDHQKRK